MRTIRIKRGLNLPITGLPRPEDRPEPAPETVAVLGPDYVGMKPTMAVQVGDRVKEGQVLFSDKKTAGVLYTSPAAARWSPSTGGPSGRCSRWSIRLAGDDAETFARYAESPARTARPRRGAQTTWCESGLWTALRTRPFSKVPSPESTPRSIFVTAIDTNPLAAQPEVVIGRSAGRLRRSG